MKKIFLAILLVNFIALNLSYGASQWDGTEPSGTSSPSDLDTYIATNNNASLERVFSNWRHGCICYLDGTSVKVGAGELWIGEGTDINLRAITSALTVTTTAAVTGYNYIYANADTDATTFTVSISAGTDYRKIGYFYQNASGTIVNVGNIGGNVGNKMKVTGTTDITTVATDYEDMTDMVVYFYSNGGPAKITFSTPIASSASAIQIYTAIYIDNTLKTYKMTTNPSVSTGISVNVDWLEFLSVGTHTIKVKWKVSTGTGRQYATSIGYRNLIVEE